MVAWGRIKQMLCTPYRGSTRKVLDFIHGLFRPSWIYKNTDELPLLVWDVRSNSITFDFVWVVFSAATYFYKKGHSKFDLLIFTPVGFKLKPMDWNGYSKQVSPEELSSRIVRLILPIAKMFDCVETICFSEAENDVLLQLKKRHLTFPRHYHPVFYYPPALQYKSAFKKLNSIKASEIPMMKPEGVKESLLNVRLTGRNSKFATFTLRDYGYAQERNTSTRDVLEFVTFAKNINATPVIIPDDMDKITDYDIPEEAVLYPEARADLLERARVYALSMVNVFSPSGPTNLSMFLPNTVTIMYNYGVQSADASIEYYKAYYGWKLGDQQYEKLNAKILWHPHVTRLTHLDLLETYKQILSKRELVKLSAT